MDDDTLWFFLIFGVIMLSIVAGAWVYGGGLEQVIEPKPTVWVLKNNNLTRKQTIAMPMTVQGQLVKGSNPSTIFYIYNPMNYRQRIHITWSLFYELNQSYVTMTANYGNQSYIELGKEEMFECQLTFSVDANISWIENRKFESVPTGSNVISVNIQSEKI